VPLCSLTTGRDLWKGSRNLPSVLYVAKLSHIRHALAIMTRPIHGEITCDSSDPEGNFEGNQLLGGSMSLSPLCQALTNDLHVSTATGFHRSFPRLHRSKA